ncbi:MAG: hypothetical protein ACP5NP_00285 [Acetobacteraceae bacterium]
MTEQVKAAHEAHAADDMAELRARAEALERQLAALQRETEARLIMAELKAEAQKAGIIDLDGLKLVDSSRLKLNAEGEVEGAAALIAELKRAKPWLFGAASSSTTAKAPTAQPPRQKLASEMNDEEYRTARAALLKRRG